MRDQHDFDTAGDRQALGRADCDAIAAQCARSQVDVGKLLAGHDVYFGIGISDFGYDN